MHSLSLLLILTVFMPFFIFYTILPNGRHIVLEAKYGMDRGCLACF
jgi:hypothetical protein